MKLLFRQKGCPHKVAAEAARRACWHWKVDASLQPMATAGNRHFYVLIARRLAHTCSGIAPAGSPPHIGAAPKYRGRRHERLSGTLRPQSISSSLSKQLPVNALQELPRSGSAVAIPAGSGESGPTIWLFACYGTGEVCFRPFCQARKMGPRTLRRRHCVGGRARWSCSWGKSHSGP